MKDLLQIMLDEISDGSSNSKILAGLCSLNMYVYVMNVITEKEGEEIRRFIRKNTPPPEERFDNLYWWEPHQWAPRIEWLKNKINELENRN